MEKEIACSCSREVYWSFAGKSDWEFHVEFQIKFCGRLVETNDQAEGEFHSLAHFIAGESECCN